MDTQIKTKIPTQCHLWQKENLTSYDLAIGDTFEVIKTYTDESHLIRSLVKCKQCGQLYFHEFYEEIDWENGKDPQYTTYIPIEDIEAADELNKTNQLELLQFSPRLQNDFPSDADKPIIKWIR